MIFLLLLATGGHAQEPDKIWFQFQPVPPLLANPLPELTHSEMVGCHCRPVATRVSALAPHLPDEVLGTAELRLEVRRRKLKLVTVSTVSPAMVPYMPCIRNELATLDWRVRRTTIHLNVGPRVLPP